MISSHARRLALATMLALVTAACSHGPAARPQAAPAATVATPATEIDAIADLLDQGQEDAARKRLKAALKRDAMNPSLLLLRDSIEGDPKELLGPTSFPYTTRNGDTMPGLAQKFLGNRLKAYQLARYNGIARPVDLAAGRTLRIPGEPPRPEPPVRRPDPRPTAPAPTKAKPTPAKPVAAPAGPATNPAAARASRAAGLAALNAGNPARAVALLRHASVLDPGNALIARDLARAERIAATVKARK